MWSRTFDITTLSSPTYLLKSFAYLGLLIMYPKTIAAILLTFSMFGASLELIFLVANSPASAGLGALAAPVPAGQLRERGCVLLREYACLRDVAADVAEEGPFDQITG